MVSNTLVAILRAMSIKLFFYDDEKKNILKLRDILVGQKDRIEMI